MRKDRVWIGGGVVAAVIVAAVAWVFFFSPQLDAKADAEQQYADAQTQNIVLQQKINKLRDQAAHADELQAELRAVQAAVPPAHDLQGFTRQLTQQAKDSGVTITGITPSVPTQIVKSTASQQQSSSSGADDSASDASDDGDAATDTPPPSTSKSSGAAGKLYSIVVSVVTTGTMDQQRDFLAALEKDGARRSLVVAVSFAPDTQEADAAEAGDGADDSNAGNDAGTPATGDDDAADHAANDEDAAADQEPSEAGAPDDLHGSWTLTTQLQVFVAPQSPDQEQALMSELRDDK